MTVVLVSGLRCQVIGGGTGLRDVTAAGEAVLRGRQSVVRARFSVAHGSTDALKLVRPAGTEWPDPAPRAWP